MSSFEGVKPFQSNDSEHPHINYRHMPVRGLYELTVLVDALKASLPDVACPVTLIQGSDDPVVVPEGINDIAERLAEVPVELKIIESERHGIINEDIGETRATIVASLDAWAHPAGGGQSLS
jgi:alpha-beta hydrolase superfamily lysophospholipase